jgi:hypothetical protein
MKTSEHAHWFVLLLSLTASACNSQPPFVEVTGVVKLDGMPMPDALVEFLPDPEQGTHGPRSSAKTDAEGRFRLIRDNNRHGAVVGFHRVLIQDARTFPPPRNRWTKNEPSVMPPSRISNRYENATVTPLRHEVKAESQSIVLEVSSR